jgi:N utilization substance protein A
MAINAVDFLNALEEIEASKGISKATILTMLEESLIKAYKKQLGGDDADVRVNIDVEKGIIEMYQAKKVVDEVEDDFLEVSVQDANALDPNKKYVAGDEFLIYASIDELRKATAMSVKSMLKQKFAEAEKSILYETFKDKIGTLITGKVEKVDDRGISVNIVKTSVYLPKKELIGDERFIVGETIKIYVDDVASGTKGAHIVVSRSKEGFLRCLFMEEIHDVYDGTVIIKNIAREAGERSKVAVYSHDPNIDPAGSCIGPNGSRIQKIVSQLGNGGINKEKIDIIAYSDNMSMFIMESLKPATALGIILDEEKKAATVIVKDDSLSLAIGRRGVNVRLAVKLTGYNIDVKTESQALEEGLEYVSYNEIQLQEEAKKAALQAAAIKEENKETEVLRGLPEGYVAPQDRVYDDDSSSEDEDERNEALEVEAERKEVKEEIIEEEAAPVIEEAPIVEEVKPQPVVKEEKKVEEHKEVKTTTSIEELEKSLADESSKKANKQNKKSFKKNNKKAEEETEENDKPVISTGERMSIYTEEELRQFEEEEQEQEEYDDEEVDYDEYDEYYDDDDR